MDDDYFWTLRLPLPSAAGLSRSGHLDLTLIPDWTVLADAAGTPLPPQQWATPVATAMETALEVAEGFIEDGDERAQLVLRLVAASAADVEGTVLTRAFQVNEFGVLGLTVTVLEAATSELALHDQAAAEHAEATMLTSAAVPRYLRLARDARTGDVSSDLLVALAAEDRPTAVKYAETDARADALLEQARNPPLVREEPEEPVSGELWLRFVVPLPHHARLALTFCGYGDRGMDTPLAEASRVAAALDLG